MPSKLIGSDAVKNDKKFDKIMEDKIRPFVNKHMFNEKETLYFGRELDFASEIINT
jgi:hypothetical protein